MNPLSYVIMVLLYYDARVKHEGYDIELTAQSASVGEPTGVT